jgi:hypothetical protein
MFAQYLLVHPVPTAREAPRASACCATLIGSVFKTQLFLCSYLPNQLLADLPVSVLKAVEY